MYSHLFTELEVGGVKLKNRLTMAPLYLGYAGEDGIVSELILDHYRLMAQSGVALVVVENATVDYPVGRNSNHCLRVDGDDQIEALSRLATAIKQEGAVACLQINHGGRYAVPPGFVAPSAVETFGRMPRALIIQEIEPIIDQYAQAALRVKQAGFDMVELHGGTGYLLAQFVSPRTNKRTDIYGGSPEARRKFPLDVVAAVKAVVGEFPVGYRFLADEWLPDGLQLAESRVFARSLDAAGVAYISVMGGTYESFFLPEMVAKSKQEGYMVDLAAAIKQEVSGPVITAGRIAHGPLAEQIVASGQADLIGLARVLWADPEWPQKVQVGKEDEIHHCNPECDVCLQMIMKGRPALCASWPKEKMQLWKSKLQK
ncbi:MAG: NADH:flavin oxidoreductase [Deltaproteobacteria bacterium]|nr:NADH:flavin oxidoreductase [Deltaproteobacteria bacterium]